MKMSLFLLIVWGLLSLSCQQAGGGGTPHPLAVREKLDVPPALYDNVLRFSADKIMLEVDHTRYYWLNENRFVQTSIGDDPRCLRTLYAFSTALPDGRLGYKMTCPGRWPDKPVGGDTAEYVVAYDWETEELREIVNIPMINTSSFTWNPTMTKGIQSVGLLLGTFQWITPVSSTPMTLTIEDNGKGWSLDQTFVAMEDPDRVDVGIARVPSWSPDGKWVAFWASTDVIGRDGLARARGSYGLYLLDPTTLKSSQRLEKVRNMPNSQGLVWSPNSQWLVFDALVQGKEGLWLVSLTGDTLHFIDPIRGGNFNGWAWLNDQEVIATWCHPEKTPGQCDQVDVFKYDLSPLLTDTQ